jgi:hypothetical protein
VKTTTDSGSEPRTLSGARGALVLLGGAVLPTLTVLIESVSHVCAEVLFDPLPTGWHLAAALSVPAANLGVWLSLRSGRPFRGRTPALGWALGVGGLYSLFFLPTLPIALPGLVVFGLGLLPLTPHLSLIASWRLRRELRRAEAAAGRSAPRLWQGALLALAALAAADLPRTVTRVGLYRASAREPEARASGISWLRAVGSEEELRRHCYARRGVSMDVLGVLWLWERPVPVEEARAVYYRVTGRPFNAAPRPGPRRLRLGPGWDWELGGEQVGGRVQGLSVRSSRLDGRVDAESALAYLEWTLEFQNDTPDQQEARAQVALPPGGVVSRVTLWIDGEEREAAFGGRAAVRAAYQQVVRKRRDPLLVTSAGPDRVLMQCFPVPPHGSMKVRIGVTAPLRLPTLGRGELSLPHFTEWNFDGAEDLRHALWVEGSGPLSGPAPLAAEGVSGGGFALRGDVGEGELGRLLLVVGRDPATLTIRAQAEVDGELVAVEQRLASRPADVTEVVVVVDGSVGMRPYAEEVAASLPPEAAVLVAGDETSEVRAPDLAALRLRGGADNGPALARAWDRASGRGPGVVVWLYAPQPVLLESPSSLRQRLERRPGAARLIALAATPGPNRTLEELEGLPDVETWARGGSIGEDLEALLASLGSERIVRELGLAEASPGAGPRAAHVVRLWAFERVRALARSAASTGEARELAVRHQLVTPVSGAVVLESRAQYEAAGLEPAPPDSVPTVPEPETWALLILVGATLAWTLRRRREGGAWRCA